MTRPAGFQLLNNPVINRDCSGYPSECHSVGFHARRCEGFENGDSARLAASGPFDHDAFTFTAHRGCYYSVTL